MSEKKTLGVPTTKEGRSDIAGQSLVQNISTNQSQKKAHKRLFNIKI
jgi:hypothetical protein